MRSDPGHIEHLAFPWIASSSSPVERRASLDALSLLAMSVLSNRVAFQRSRKHQPSHLRLRAGFVFAKVLLRYLANRRLRQRVADFHGADHFVLSETLLQKRLHLLERQRRRAGLQLDEGLRGLAAIVVRNSDDAHFLDPRVLIDGLLDVARIDVEAAAEQHVLGPVDDIDEAVLVHIGDVARAEEAVRRHRVRGRFRLLPVALSYIWTLDADFAPFAELDLSLRVGDVNEFHLCAGIRKAAGSAPSRSFTRVEGSDRRSLGHAPALIQLAANDALEPLLHRHRQRRAAGAA